MEGIIYDIYDDINNTMDDYLQRLDIFSFKLYYTSRPNKIY